MIAKASVSVHQTSILPVEYMSLNNSPPGDNRACMDGLNQLQAQPCNLRTDSSSYHITIDVPSLIAKPIPLIQNPGGAKPAVEARVGSEESQIARFEMG